MGRFTEQEQQGRTGWGKTDAWKVNGGGKTKKREAEKEEVLVLVVTEE